MIDINKNQLWTKKSIDSIFNCSHKIDSPKLQTILQVQVQHQGLYSVHIPPPSWLTPSLASICCLIYRVHASHKCIYSLTSSFICALRIISYAARTRIYGQRLSKSANIFWATTTACRPNWPKGWRCVRTQTDSIRHLHTVLSTAPHASVKFILFDRYDHSFISAFADDAPLIFRYFDLILKNSVIRSHWERDLAFQVLYFCGNWKRFTVRVLLGYLIKCKCCRIYSLFWAKIILENPHFSSDNSPICD